MVLNNDIKDLNLAFHFNIDDLNYTMFVTTENVKCFGLDRRDCVRLCPQKNTGPSAGAAGQSEAEEGDRESSRKGNIQPVQRREENKTPAETTNE